MFCHLIGRAADFRCATSSMCVERSTSMRIYNSEVPRLSRSMPVTRCEWPKSELMIAYHDDEWGEPSRDDRHLFEHLVLEGAQAGLSWELVLKKRNGYRIAFVNYDIEKIARFTEARVEKLAHDPSI